MGQLEEKTKRDEQQDIREDIGSTAGEADLKAWRHVKLKRDKGYHGHHDGHVNQQRIAQGGLFMIKSVHAACIFFWCWNVTLRPNAVG
ncbi:hypothetical protein [Thiocapsa sp.]|uniref:hypothetical protein n=1 Tax=Thiocapsa sp. TaxID=2024551 RepID=UPI0025DF1F20|nr:hypothetical protein [Thiocapsa sp.]